MWIKCNSVECNFHCIKTRYLIGSRERRHVKGYGFLSFARNIGTHTTKVAKNISNKYGQKLADTARKSATEAIKTTSKRAIQKATRDLVGNKVADKITSVSKKSLKKRVMKNHHQLRSIMKYQKKDIYLQKKGNKLLMN